MASIPEMTDEELLKAVRLYKKKAEEDPKYKKTLNKLKAEIASRADNNEEPLPKKKAKVGSKKIRESRTNNNPEKQKRSVKMEADNKANFGSVIGPAFKLVFKEPLFHIVGFFLIGLVANLCFVLVPPLMVGYFVGIQRQIDGEKPDLGVIFNSFDKFLDSFIAYILSQLIIFAGLLLLVIPGICLAPLGMLPLIAIARNDQEKGMDALKLGFVIIKTDPVGVILGFFVLSLIASLGAFACYIGLFITIPVAFVGVYLMYLNMIGKDWSSALED